MPSYPMERNFNSTIMALGKRKRNLGDKSSVVVSAVSPMNDNEYLAPSLEQETSDYQDQETLQSYHSNLTLGPVSPSIPPKKLPKFVSKRPRSRSRGTQISQPDISPSHFSSRPHTHQPLQDKPAVVNQTRCHVCFKYPRFKTQLNFYTNCERCDQRTCMICLRTCEAELDIGCMGRKVCSDCCVEKGEAGVVYCTECVEVERDVEDEMMEED